MSKAIWEDKGRLYADVAESAYLPGIVHCTICHRTEQVDPATCLRTGWPVCCGQTMSIDPPPNVERDA